jgi:hypothetical protein
MADGIGAFLWFNTREQMLTAIARDLLWLEAGEVGLSVSDANTFPMPGKEAALPPLPPLRTGLESFPSSGSSLSNAP